MVTVHEIYQLISDALAEYLLEAEAHRTFDICNKLAG
jgi:hypothetical protein